MSRSIPAIRVERCHRFWADVAAHPLVRETLYGLTPEDVGALVSRADILPLASANGGFLFSQLDGIGLVRDLHTLFRPEGWGREALLAGAAALDVVFEHTQILTTLELRESPRSQPPRSFGFRPAGDWTDTQFGPARGWSLTRAVWLSSPGARTCR